MSPFGFLGVNQIILTVLRQYKYTIYKLFLLLLSYKTIQTLNEKMCNAERNCSRYLNVFILNKINAFNNIK